MRRMLAATTMAALLIPATAVASPVTKQDGIEYAHAWLKERHLFGAGAAGCNVLGHLGSCHIPQNVLRNRGHEIVQASLVTLHHDLNPAPPVASVTSSEVTSSTTDSTSSSVSSPAPTSGGSGGSSHIQCIIQHESSGDPQAVSGQYSGIGQWNAEAWAQDGGTKFAGSPTGASYDQQLQVLQSEGDAGLSQQQGQFDGCG